MFPSPLTSSQSDPRRTDTSSSHVNDGRMSAVHRKSLKSSRSIPPVAKRSNGRNKAPAHFTSASVREQSTKSSVFIADSSPRQQNHIPSVKYFTRRSLLKIPVSDQAKCGSNSSDKALGNRALSSLDSALPADRVSGCFLKVYIRGVLGSIKDCCLVCECWIFILVDSIHIN